MKASLACWEDYLIQDFGLAKVLPLIETVNKGPTQKGCEGLGPTQGGPNQYPFNHLTQKNLMGQAYSSPKVPIMCILTIWV